MGALLGFICLASCMVFHWFGWIILHPANTSHELLMWVLLLLKHRTTRQSTQFVDCCIMPICHFEKWKCIRRSTMCGLDMIIVVANIIKYCFRRVTDEGDVWRRQARAMGEGYGRGLQARAMGEGDGQGQQWGCDGGRESAKEGECDFDGNGRLSLVGFDEGVGFKEGLFLGCVWIEPRRFLCKLSSSGGYEEGGCELSCIALLLFRVGVMKEEGTHIYLENIPNHVHKDVHNNWA